MNLWNRTLEAYNRNDLETLRLLANILIEDIEVEKISSLEILKNRIQDLCRKIDCILEEIANNKEQFPINIKDKILDNEWVSEEIDSYKKVITQLEEAIKSYSAFLKGIEEES
ncbi:hypothetical protein [Clostridium sp. YIM B02551]|uniref:hypothetical protein n=1 Tax=Clostridium sp. YIM B02551 TaxID=2910679 RepID=UPI001EEBBEC1|nr:hypothetical protein [Clostridium sp. YIM B02551]